MEVGDSIGGLVREMEEDSDGEGVCMTAAFGDFDSSSAGTGVGAGVDGVCLSGGRCLNEEDRDRDGGCSKGEEGILSSKTDWGRSWFRRRDDGRCGL